jgi:hypothetical protein
VGSKSYSSRRDALALVENFQSIFNENSQPVHVAPTNFSELQEFGERSTADALVFGDADAEGNEPEQHYQKENSSEQRARFKRELFDSAERLTTEAEEGVGLLSVAQGMKRWHQAWNAVTSIQLQHLTAKNAPKALAWSDRGSGGSRQKTKPCVPDFLADVWLAARRALTATQFQIWNQLIVEEKGERLEEFAKSHSETYGRISQLVGIEFDQCLLYPSRTYFEVPHSIAVSRRSARLRHEAEEVKKPATHSKTGRRLHRKAA